MSFKYIVHQKQKAGLSKPGGGKQPIELAGRKEKVRGKGRGGKNDGCNNLGSHLYLLNFMHHMEAATYYLYRQVMV